MRSALYQAWLRGYVDYISKNIPVVDGLDSKEAEQYVAGYAQSSFDLIERKKRKKKEQNAAT